MTDKITLSEGVLPLIMRGSDIEDPIMQVLGSKRIAFGSSQKERFRLLLSDGKYVMSFAMLSREINDKSSSRELAINTVIKIKQYFTSFINCADKGNKGVLVICEIETLVPGEKTRKIGNPVQLPEDNTEQDAPVTNRAATNRHNGHNGHLNSISSNRPVAVASAIRHNIRDLNVSLLNHLTQPISSLSPCQSRWMIKARVRNKIRTWPTSHGEDELFSMDLIDESGEIRATVFNDLIDKFDYMIEFNKVYYISKCILKVANKQFTTLKNDYEMIFTNDTIVQECHDVFSSISQAQTKFISIETGADVETETLIADKIGVCKSTSTTIQDQLTEMNSDIKKIIEGNKNNSEEIKQLRAAIENREKVIDSQNEKISKLQGKIENQEVRINCLEKETKKRNLICYGVEEKSQENKKRRNEYLCSWCSIVN